MRAEPSAYCQRYCLARAGVLTGRNCAFSDACRIAALR